MDYKLVKLNYEEYGKGVPVILVHGFPLDHSIWKEVTDLIEGQVRVILPDLRGFGNSPLGEDEGGMRAMAEDIAGLMDEMGIEKAILAGHSMGGYVCLNFARAHPRRLMGLALVATQAGADTLERRQARLATAAEVKRKGVKVVAEGMASHLTCNPELVEPLKKLMLKASPKGVIAALVGMAERLDATDWLAEIHVPTAVVAGKQDGIIPLERSRTMVQMLNHGWLVEVDEAGHMPMLETPRVVAEAILQLVQLAR